MQTDSFTTTIREITQKFTEKFADLNEEQLNWKPNAKTWSIAQNIDHLVVTNSLYFNILNEIRNGSYELVYLGKIGFIVNFMGAQILKSVGANRKNKMRTFPVFEPSKSGVKGDILEKFYAHQNELAQMMENSHDLIAKKTVIASPANKNIVYSLETAFQIIIEHEKRHFEQALEIYQQLK